MNCVTHHECDCIAMNRIELGNKIRELESSLEATKRRCEWAEAMLERARDYIDMCHDESGTGNKFLADLAAGPEKERGGG